MDKYKRFFAEAIGTFWLVLGGCGSAVISAGFPETGIGFLGVSLAFGLTVLTGAYALGHVSGAHFNPAITLGLAAAGKFPKQEVVPYVVSQVIGAVGASLSLYLIASGQPDFSLSDGFATNGYGYRSPGGYELGSVLFTEFLLTGLFVYLILEVTSQDAIHGFAPLAVGLTLTLIHLISIPISNTSVNPARSTGPAVIAGGAALTQLWAFWVAPIAGGAVVGMIHRWLSKAKPSSRKIEEYKSKERPLKRASSA
jgi:aquaporin Z